MYVCSSNKKTQTSKSKCEQILIILNALFIRSNAQSKGIGLATILLV